MKPAGYFLLAILAVMYLQETTAKAPETRLWTLDADGQCYERRQKDAYVMSCEAGARLTEQVSRLKDTVAKMQTMINNQTDVIASIQADLDEEEVKATVVTASISLSPSRRGANCADLTANCGVLLTVDGTGGIVCYPSTFNERQQEQLALLILADTGVSSGASLVKYYVRAAPSGTYQYGADYFDSPDGLPGYWDLNDCSAVNVTTLEDYATCAQPTTFDQCSVNYTQRHFTVFQTP